MDLLLGRDYSVSHRGCYRRILVGNRYFGGRSICYSLEGGFSNRPFLVGKKAFVFCGKIG